MFVIYPASFGRLNKLGTGTLKAGSLLKEGFVGDTAAR